ncbi:MAG: extracellular solute-binding protein [Spirochaetales bacterium]|nr:extracellular solute-binding protein [Spirochaetales bacterium]
MKKGLTILVVMLCALSLFASGGKEATTTTSTVPELKGPGNVTLKRLGYNVGFDVNNDIIVGVTEESTGYKVEYYALPAQNADEKLLMEVASGKDYDIVNLSVDQWRTLVANGALLPLNDLLDAYGQDILKGNTQDVWKALSDEKGNIYGVAYMYPYDTEVNNFMIVRMDLLRKAGIDEVPTTLEGFYNMLKTLKAFYGEEYIILAGPYKNAANGSNSLVFPQIISSAFGISNDWMVDENNKVYYMSESEKFDELVSFLAKCASEGLFDPDWAANTTASVTEKFASGRAIIACGDRNLAQAAIPTLMSNQGLTEDDFGFLGPLEGEDGVCTYQESLNIGKISAILKNSKNAADAINWINLKIQDQLFINIGVEGVHFYYDEEGQIAPINPIFADERGNSFYYIDATDAEEFKFEWPSRIRKSAAQWLAFENVTLKTNAERPEVFVKNPFAFMPASENYAKYNTTLLNSLNDFVLQVMAGKRNVSDIPTYMSDWKNNGGEAVRAELQSYIDAQ